MTPGIALIIGVLIGAAAVYFLMQTKTQKRERALQQSRARVAQLEQEQEDRLSEVAHQLETKYEQQLSEKIEQYQDEYEQQAAELEAEYEMRLTILGAFGEAEASETEASEGDTETSKAEASEANEPDVAGAIGDPREASDTRQLNDEVNNDDSTGQPSTGLTASVAAAGAGVAAATAAIIPDPWEEPAPAQPSAPTQSPAPISKPTETEPDSTITTSTPIIKNQPPTEVRVPSSTTSQQIQDINAISELLTHNRRALPRVLPSLSKLSQDPDTAVRLAVIETLKKTESIKAIPLLRKALRDSDNDVVAAANKALDRFKGTQTSPTKTPKKKLPKNQ